jgi:hypothetical protein
VGVEVLDGRRMRKGVWQHALLGRNVGDVSYLGVLFVSGVPCTLDTDTYHLYVDPFL